MRTKHVQHEKNIYTSNNCNTLFYNKKLLISHLKNEMQLTQIYKQVCSFENCNKIFKTFKMYSNHLETIHEVNKVHNKLNFNTIEGTYILATITFILRLANITDNFLNFYKNLMNGNLELKKRKGANMSNEHLKNIVGIKNIYISFVIDLLIQGLLIM